LERTSVALAVFAALAVALASFSATEYSIPSRSSISNNSTTTESITAPPVTTTVTTILTSTITTVSMESANDSELAQVLLPGVHCCVDINGTTFAYTQWNESIPSSFTFDNVTFSIVVTEHGSNLTSVCLITPNNEVGYLEVTFADGISDQLNFCVPALGAPSTTLLLASHVDPEAGYLRFGYTGDFYFLVSTSAEGTSSG